MLLVKAVFFLYFYKDNVIADLADAFPGDDVFTFPPEKITEPSWTGNHQSSKAAGDAVKFHVDGTAKAPAGTGIDNFFLF